MGGCCSTSENMSNEYIVELYKLIKTDEEGIFEINLSATEIFEKNINNSFFTDCSESSNNLLSTIPDPNTKKNVIFYVFSGHIPAVKNYKNMKHLFPYKIQDLKRIIILLINEAIEENFTKDLIKKVFDNEDIFSEKIVDLRDFKKFTNFLNPILTDDDLKFTDENQYNNNSDNNNTEDIIHKENEYYIEEVIGLKTIKRLEKILFYKKSNSLISKSQKNKMNSIDTNCLSPNKEDESDNNSEIELNNDSRKIDKIIIRNSKITQMEIFSEMIELLIKYNNLKKFAFYSNGNDSNFKGWFYIGKLLELNYNIRYIDLHSSNLYDIHLKYLTQSIKDKRIRYLDLSENFLSLEGIKVFSDFLKTNKTLQRLYLQRNGVCQFKKEGVEIVCKCLYNHPNLRYIDLSFMEITGGGIYIKKLIETVNLEFLCLRCCKLNYQDFKDVCGAMINNKTINHFDLSMNDQGGNKSLEELSKVIRNNKNINTFYLDQLNINMDNYNIIFDAIESNNNIYEFSFSLNPKLKVKFLLNFFIKKEEVKSLEFIPYSDNEQKKEFTLEEKKLIDKFKKERPDIKLIIN